MFHVDANVWLRHDHCKLATTISDSSKQILEESLISWMYICLYYDKKISGYSNEFRSSSQKAHAQEYST